jgi:hypothetical protein
MISDIADACKDPTYFIDDTLRTVQLFQRAGRGRALTFAGLFIWDTSLRLHLKI